MEILQSAFHGERSEGWGGGGYGEERVNNGFPRLWEPGDRMKKLQRGRNQYLLKGRDPELQSTSSRKFKSPLPPCQRTHSPQRGGGVPDFK